MPGIPATKSEKEMQLLLARCQVVIPGAQFKQLLLFLNFSGARDASGQMTETNVS